MKHVANYLSILRTYTLNWKLSMQFVRNILRFDYVSFVLSSFD
jgi:hypothetical protein